MFVDGNDVPPGTVVPAADVPGIVERARLARPELRFDIDAVLGDGDQVAVVGRTGTSNLIWLVRLRDGRMAEMTTYHQR